VPVVLRKALEADIPGITYAYLTPWREAYKGLLLPDLVIAQRLAEPVTTGMPESSLRPRTSSWRATTIRSSESCRRTSHRAGPGIFPRSRCSTSRPTIGARQLPAASSPPGRSGSPSRAGRQLGCGWSSRKREPAGSASEKAGRRTLICPQRVLPAPLLPAALHCVITANRWLGTVADLRSRAFIVPMVGFVDLGGIDTRVRSTEVRSRSLITASKSPVGIGGPQGVVPIRVQLLREFDLGQRSWRPECPSRLRWRGERGRLVRLAGVGVRLRS